MFVIRFRNKFMTINKLKLKIRKHWVSVLVNIIYFLIGISRISIALINKVHPMAYGCTFFMPLSYLLLTIWVLVACYFAASVALIFGLITDEAILCAIWIWYSVIFLVLMLMMMVLLALVYTSRRQRSKVIVVILAMLWYLLTIYFVLVVNSYRKNLTKTQVLGEKINDKL